MWVVIFILFYYFLDLCCGKCNIISLYFLYRSICCLGCYVFAIFLGMFAILLLNVMELLSGGKEVICWLYHIWSSKECMCCACDLIVYWDAPSIGFVCVCIWRKCPPHLRIWEMDQRCLHSSCCLFMCFCILCGRLRACICYAIYPMAYCACLPSEWCW